MEIFDYLFGYSVFSHCNKNNEPIHVHIGTKECNIKIWILVDGSVKLETKGKYGQNISKFRNKDIKRFITFVYINKTEIIKKWMFYFGYGEFLVLNYGYYINGYSYTINNKEVMVSKKYQREDGSSGFIINVNTESDTWNPENERFAICRCPENDWYCKYGYSNEELDEVLSYVISKTKNGELIEKEEIIY